MDRPDEQGEDIPQFVAECIDFIDNESVLNTEGIFRLSGNIEEIEQLRGLVDSGKNPKLHGTNVVCSLLKMWLNMLPTPLLLTHEKGAMPLTYTDWSKALEAAANDPNKFDVIGLISRLEPKAKYVTTSLFKLLCKVVAHSRSNRMDLHNVAVCFAPTLFNTVQAQKEAELKESGIVDAGAVVDESESKNALSDNAVGMNIIKCLIENYERVFATAQLEQAKYAERVRKSRARMQLERLTMKDNITFTSEAIDVASGSTLKITRPQLARRSMPADALMARGRSMSCAESIQDRNVVAIPPISGATSDDYRAYPMPVSGLGVNLDIPQSGERNAEGPPPYPAGPHSYSSPPSGTSAKGRALKPKKGNTIGADGISGDGTPMSPKKEPEEEEEAPASTSLGVRTKQKGHRHKRNKSVKHKGDEADDGNPETPDKETPE